MPPAAAIGIGMGASALGGMLGQGAANKGPRSMFPGQLQQYISMLSPWANTSAGTMQQMAATGMPTDVGPAWNAMVSANQRMTTQGMNNLMTQFAGGGMRYSTNAMNAGVDYTTQSNKNFMQILADYTLQAQEAARQRQLAAAEGGMGAFGNLATIFTNPKGSVLGAGMSSVGSSLQLISLMKSLGLFRGGEGGGGGFGAALGGDQGMTV